MKRSSEGELGIALRGMDFDPAPYVLKLPDPKTGAGVSNWKPCDFLVWYPVLDENLLWTRSAWIEAKDTDQVNTFPYADLRPAQIAGIIQANELVIPYLLAVWWRKARRWTISDAYAVLQWFNQGIGAGGTITRPTSIGRELLMSRFGVDASNDNLGQTIRVILEEGW